MELRKKLQRIFIPAAFAAISLPGHAQTFTAAQATEGQSAYSQNCAACHGVNLDDGEFAPPVKGTAFTAQWGGKSIGELFTYIRTKMPPSNAGGLGDPVYLQITAFLLQSNGIPLDAKSLPGAGPSAAPTGKSRPAARPSARRRPLTLRQPDSGAAQAQSARQTYSRYRRGTAKPSGRRVAHLAAHL